MCLYSQSPAQWLLEEFLCSDRRRRRMEETGFLLIVLTPGKLGEMENLSL